MGILGYLGRNARDPHTAGLVVGAGAAVFNFVWLFYPPPIHGLSSWPLTGSALVLFLIGTVNAYVATRIVWWAFVPTDRALSIGRAAAVGVGLGPFSMFTFAAFGLPLLAFPDLFVSLDVGSGFGILLFPVHLVLTGLLGTVYGLYFTVGIPIVITTSGALGLAVLEQRYG